jgi:NAD(P)-dependent dehydrogenase (short-subunit alcohol dehydrogenase family)
MRLDALRIFDLTGRTALVTGARREIGKAIALGLAALGARLAVHHAGTEEEARDAAGVVAEIRANGGAAKAFGCDFTQDGAAKRLAADVLGAFGSVDILALNASIELVENWQSVTRERFDRQIAVNLRTTLELLQELVPPMAERGWGRVLAIGSIQQAVPHEEMIVYASTKAAQENWMRNLARQYGGRGATFNNLAPGVILTARNRAALEGRETELAERIPLRRLGRPEDLAGAAMLFCSDAGAYITGANLFVDGGWRVAR